MTSQPASVRSLKRLMSQVPTSAELTTVLLDLNREKNGRAWAITLAALLDAALESAIHTKLIPNISKGDRDSLFEGHGILTTFSAKIEMAFVLGLIGPETRKDLDCIREIRNAFAHAKGIISFDTKEVVTVCARLKFPTRNLFDGYKQPTSARDNYQITATLLMQLFYSLGTLAKYPLLSPHWLPLLQH
jgi:DNA-binding MltR family transcriptional regulator